MFTEKDKELIKELGLQDLSEAEQAGYLQQFYNTLQMQVGMILEDTLSGEQLADFEKVSKKGDDKATAEWLKQAVPDFDKHIAEEQAALVQEIRESAASIRKVINEPSEPADS